MWILDQSRRRFGGSSRQISKQIDQCPSHLQSSLGLTNVRQLYRYTGITRLLAIPVPASLAKSLGNLLEISSLSLGHCTCSASFIWGGTSRGRLYSTQVYSTQLASPLGKRRRTEEKVTLLAKLVNLTCMFSLNTMPLHPKLSVVGGIWYARKFC